MLKNRRTIRELNFRADYSYTRLENLIQFIQGRYDNVAERGIHSAEFLGKLYLQGGHRVELSYTWLQISTADKGRFRSMPEHWFNLSGVFSLLPETLQATGTVLVRGALEDPNRLVEYRDYELNELGRPRLIGSPEGTEESLFVQPHELVMDRIAPRAELQVGVTYTGIRHLRLSAHAYNALDARNHNPDAFFDYEPRLEFVPNPFEDFRFLVNATYTY